MLLICDQCRSKMVFNEHYLNFENDVVNKNDIKFNTFAVMCKKCHDRFNFIICHHSENETIWKTVSYICGKCFNT